MDQDKILAELIGLLEQMDIKVKYDRGNFRGGLVRYHDENIMFINRRAETETKINTIVTELSEVEIPDEFLNDELREVLAGNNKKEPG